MVALLLTVALSTPSEAASTAPSTTPTASASGSGAPSAGPTSASTSTPTPTPSPSGNPTTHLSNGWTVWVIALTIAFILIAGWVISVGRQALERGNVAKNAGGDNGDAPDGNQPDRTLIRSWLAVSLVGGLLIFCGASFAIDDATLRSTLMGGLVASAGAAVAYYFSSKAADQARQDVLNASNSGNAVAIPKLDGLTENEVNAQLSKLGLKGQFSPAKPEAGSKVTSQHPEANSQVQSGTTVTVTFTAQVAVPNLAGMTVDAVNAALAGTHLVVAFVPAPPPAAGHVTGQDPAADVQASAGTTVTVTVA